MATTTVTLDAQMRDLSVDQCDIKRPSPTFEELASADESFDWSEESESIDTEMSEMESLCLSASMQEEFTSLESSTPDDEASKGSGTSCPDNSYSYGNVPTYLSAQPKFLFTYGDMATYDDSRYSQALRIDNVSIPPHLINVIQRDSFDLNPLENRLTNTDMDGSHSRYKGRYYELTEYYNKQDLGKGEVEAVLYTRKRTAEDDNTVVADTEEDAMDAKGRFIQQTVWPSHRANSSLSSDSPSNRRRSRSPIPVREPVFQRASESSPSTTAYRTISATSQESVEYTQQILFKSSDPSFRVAKITKKSRRKALKERKQDLEAEQDELRSHQGGLLISLITGLRLEHPKHKADALANEYADAFEEWDEQMRKSPLKAFEGYAGDTCRRKWLATMWEIPDNQDS